MVERTDPHLLGPTVPPGYMPIHSREGKFFFVKRWTRTSTKYDMIMPYLRDISASPSTSKTFKVEVPTLKGYLASHATLTSENLLAGFFSRKEFLILGYHLKLEYLEGTTALNKWT